MKNVIFCFLLGFLFSIPAMALDPVIGISSSDRKDDEDIPVLANKLDCVPVERGQPEPCTYECLNSKGKEAGIVECKITLTVLVPGGTPPIQEHTKVIDPGESYTVSASGSVQTSRTITGLSSIEVNGGINWGHYL